MSVRVNLLLATLAAVIGVFTVFVKFLTVGSVSLGFILLSMLLWALPARGGKPVCQYEVTS